MSAATALNLPIPDLAMDEDEAELFCIPKEAHSLDGFREWILSDAVHEKLKATFLKGKVYLDMSNEELFTHNAVKTEVAGRLWTLNEEHDFGNLFVNGVLVTNKEAQVSNNPDMVAVFWESLDKGTVKYVRRKKGVMEILGSPDWALEIVSYSTVKKDKKELRQAYHAARIKEYWLIDARGDEIDFQLLNWRKAGYVAVASKDGWLHSAVFAQDFRLSRKRDRQGGWKYRLDSKST